ncbi:MAG: hypothetical protein WA160_06905 [Pseudobdellovibrio sp.]
MQKIENRLIEEENHKKDEFENLTTALEGSEESKFSKSKTKQNTPLIDTKISFSKDGQWFLVTRTETSIFSINYLSKMIGNKYPDQNGL